MHELPVPERGTEQLCAQVTVQRALIEKPWAQNALRSPLSTADIPQPAPRWKESAGSVCSHLASEELGVTFGMFPSEHPHALP